LGCWPLKRNGAFHPNADDGNFMTTTTTASDDDDDDDDGCERAARTTARWMRQ
jgi:hypothetical protein